MTLSNDHAEALRGELHVQVLELDGHVLKGKAHPVTLSPRSVSADATYGDLSVRSLAPTRVDVRDVQEFII